MTIKRKTKQKKRSQTSCTIQLGCHSNQRNAGSFLAAISTLGVSLWPIGLLSWNYSLYNLLSYRLLHTAVPASGLLGRGWVGMRWCATLQQQPARRRGGDEPSSFIYSAFNVAQDKLAGPILSAWESLPASQSGGKCHRLLWRKIIVYTLQHSAGRSGTDPLVRFDLCLQQKETNVHTGDSETSADSCFCNTCQAMLLHLSPHWWFGPRGNAPSSGRYSRSSRLPILMHQIRN